MNVIMVGALDPNVTHPSGTRIYILNIIKYLKKEVNFLLIGCQYTNISPKVDGYKFDPIVKDGRISSYKFLLNLFFKTFFVNISKNSIIHAHRPDHILPFILFYKKNPKILTLHGRNYEEAMVKDKGIIIGKIYESIERFVIPRVNKIIVVDKASKEFCLKKYRLSPEKIVEIPVGVDLQIFKQLDRNAARKKYNFNKDDKVILYVGRFKKEKGVDLLIKAFSKAHDEILNSKLLLVGEGPEKQNLQKLAKDLKLKDVIIIDSIEHTKVPQIMNCANVFCLCSLYEGFPTVILEALACSVPVVSTDVGGVSSIVIDGKTGHIVKRRTVKEVADKLIQTLNDGQRLNENCVEMAKKYSWPELAKRIRGVYDEVLKRV